MAEGRSIRQDNVVCRYFMSSSCRDGDRCLFSHDSSRGIADSVCRYYLQGRCAFGRNCRFDHVPVNKLVNSKSQQHNAGHSRHFTNGDVSSNHPRYESRSRRTADSVCRNYLRGRCVYGRNCRYDHLRVNEESNSNSHNDGHSAGPSRNSTNLGASSNYARSESNKQNTNHPDFNLIGQHTKIKGFNPHKRNKVPIEQEQKDMALAFAIQRSMDKTCGICMDVVLEKEHLSERKFGILEKCNHVYCFSCINKWRKTKQRNEYTGDSDITKACPECRIVSDLVTPSEYFVDSKEEKEKLVAEYKKVLSQKHCKYFKKGRGRCILGQACLYLHALPNGTRVEHPLPARQEQQIEDDILEYIYHQLTYLDPFNDDIYYDEWDDDSDYSDVDDFEYYMHEMEM